MRTRSVRTRPRVKPEASILKVEIAAYESLCEEINTPRSLACFLLLQAEEFTQLLSLEARPIDYVNSNEFADDYLVTECLKKNPRLDLGIDRKAVALEKFLQSELACRATNERFRTTRLGELPPADKRVTHVVKRARRLIRSVLGRLTPADLDRVQMKARFGPGATTAVRGAHVAYSEKYAFLEATPRLRPFLRAFTPDLWVEAASGKFTTRYASSVTTVPKNAKTDRTICIEPHLNIMVQLGTGSLLRSRLRKAGVDLRSQEWNRTLAEMADEYGLATIDLSSASDTIASAVVEYFIPHDWFHLLWISRSDMTELPDGTIIGLEKWSSMGNGYTFELETLIFWALARACSSIPSLTTSYGDDIILPQSDSPLLIEALEFCGFKVNGEKTCLAGRFFESCGTDWFMGVNVRPFYFRSEIENHMDVHDALLLYANQIRRYANRRASTDDMRKCDIRLLPAWLRCFGALPKRWRNRIPDGVGDGGLISNFDEASPAWCRNLHAIKFQLRTRPPVKRKPRRALGHLVSLLHRAPLVPMDDGCHPSYLALFTSVDRASPYRSSLKGETPYYTEAMVRTKGIPQHAEATCYSWPNLGPWG